MSSLVVHPATSAAIEVYLAHPGHAVLLSGPAGVGKAAIAADIAMELLGMDAAKLANYPYFRHLGASSDKSIAIDAIRELGSFLARKVPGGGRRVVLIEAAERLTVEAQNALLKTLEEPPEGTILVLTSSNERALLPTIISRVQRLNVSRPPAAQVKAFYEKQGFEGQKIAQAALMSGGLPGVMQAILSGDTTHPLLLAAADARKIAGGTTFERLTMVDALAKDRDHCLQVLGMLEQMAHVALVRGNAAAAWRRVLEGCYEAAALLTDSAQPKLVLTNLMLKL